jgi:hypothetical protein
MASILITLALSMGMLSAIWLLLAPRRPRLKHGAEVQHLPGHLSVAERERLYRRLGLDPAAMTRGEISNVIWLESRRQPKRRSTEA